MTTDVVPICMDPNYLNFSSTYDVPGFADKAFMGEMRLGDPKEA
jgi:hypothetical protein